MSPRDGLGVTYLPFAFSSDAGYADLPLALLRAPVSIGALVKTWVTVSCEARPRLAGRPPGTGLERERGVFVRINS